MQSGDSVNRYKSFFSLIALPGQKSRRGPHVAGAGGQGEGGEPKAALGGREKRPEPAARAGVAAGRTGLPERCPRGWRGGERHLPPNSILGAPEPGRGELYAAMPGRAVPGHRITLGWKGPSKPTLSNPLQ